MVKVLGFILLLYGVAGVIGSYLVYRALQGPIAKLRTELQALAVKLAAGGVQIKGVVSVLTDQIKPALQGLFNQLKVIATGIGITSAVFGQHRDQLAGIAAWFRSWKIPLPTATAVSSKPLNLDLSLTLNEVTFSEYNVLGFTLYGPPPTVTPKSYTLLDLGTFNVVTAVDIRERSPLEPVAGLFDLAAGKIDEVSEKLDATKDQVNEAGSFVSDQIGAAGDAAQQLRELVRDLENGRQQLDDLSRSRWLHLAPAAVIAYFGLIHLAFALTGLALLLV